MPPDTALLNVPSVIVTSEGASFSKESLFCDAFLISIVYCAFISLYLSSLAFVAFTVTVPAFVK